MLVKTNKNGFWEEAKMSEKKTVVFLVSYGTSIIRAKAASYDLIAKELGEYSGLPVWQVFTDDDTARAVSVGMGERRVFTIEDAVETAIGQRFDLIKVVPVFMARGELYYTTQGRLEFFRDRIDIEMADCVLGSQEACREVATALLESMELHEDTEYLLVSHGNPKFPGTSFTTLEEVLVNELGHKNMKIVRLEERDAVGQAINFLKKNEALEKNATVYITPLTVAWGDYMASELYNDQDSFMWTLRKAGYRTIFSGIGLGEYPQFRKLYCKHLDTLQG